MLGDTCDEAYLPVGRRRRALLVGVTECRANGEALACGPWQRTFRPTRSPSCADSSPFTIPGATHPLTRMVQARGTHRSAVSALARALGLSPQDLFTQVRSNQVQATPAAVALAHEAAESSNVSRSKTYNYVLVLGSNSGDTIGALSHGRPQV